MLCPNCKEPVKGDLEVCPACGATLTDTPPEENVLIPDEGIGEETESTDAENADAENADAENADNENADNEETPKKKFYKPLWILIALGVAGLVTLIIFFLANGSFYFRAPFTTFEDDLLPVCVERDGVTRWGYLDKNGDMAIAPIFEAASPFTGHGLAAVCVDGKWGFVNEDGELAVPCTFEAAGDFSRNGLAPVKKDGTWGYINKGGKIVINPQFDGAQAFSDEGIALVMIDDLYGYINRRGVYVIPPQFEAARGFAQDGYATVKSYGYWGLIDKHGNYVINPQFDALYEFSANGLALVVKNGKCGYIDRDGVYVVEPTYAGASSFSENGLALVQTNEGLYGFINKRGEFAVEARFYDARPFENGLAAVQFSAEAELWGYIDKHGEVVIEPKYSVATSFGAGLAAVLDSTGSYYINKKGEEVIRIADENKIGGRFTADGYAVVFCYDIATGSIGSFQIIDTSGRVIHEETLLSLPLDHRYYALP